MKVCVFGAGAVGGHFATRLAAAGVDVSVVARGANLAAIRERGLTLRLGDETISAKVRASDHPAELGPQDYVVATVKATGLSAFAEQSTPLIGPDTSVVFAQNGTPWWYGIGLPADKPRAPDLNFLDPDGRLATALPRDRLIGGVIISSNEVVGPGVVQADTPENNALIIGRVDDALDGRVDALRAALTKAGLLSPVAPDIRHVVWTKLVNNMTVSVLCLLTGMTARAAVEDPELSPLVRHLFGEAYGVAAAHGSTLAPPTGGRAPDHKPSILQDFEQGRELEIDALVRGPAAFARAAGLDTPILDTLAGLAIQKARASGLYSRNP